MTFTNAIILNCRPFFESDRLLTLFSQSKGKLTVLASRANAKSSPFSGLLDVGTAVSVTTRAGKSFTYLNQCQLVNAFSMIRKSYNRIAMMQHFCELMIHATAFEHPDPMLFELLFQTLSRLDQQMALDSVQRQFYCEFLKIEGLLSPDCAEISISEFLTTYAAYSGKTVVLPPLMDTRFG